MSASDDSARLWAEITQAKVMVIITQRATGWQLTAEIGRRNSIATGNANTAAEVSRILRSVMPELFEHHPGQPEATGDSPAARPTAAPVGEPAGSTEAADQAAVVVVQVVNGS